MPEKKRKAVADEFRLDEDEIIKVALDSLKTPEQAVVKTVEFLSGEGDLRMLSEIAPEEDLPLAVELDIAEDFGYDWLERIIYHRLALRASRHRLGRRELRDIAIGTRERAEERRFFKLFRWPWRREKEERRPFF